jgi:UPF0716 protein FxsA
MNPLLLVLLILIVIPLGELFVLIEVGQSIGALSTIALAIFTAVLGLYLLKQQGRDVASRINDALRHQVVPTVESMEALILLFCAILLITPGFITDIVGFLALIPVIRQAICAHFLPISKNPTVRKSDTNEDARTIEGRYTIDED